MGGGLVPGALASKVQLQGGGCGELNTVLLCGSSLECLCERARAMLRGEFQRTTHATGVSESPKHDGKCGVREQRGHDSAHFLIYIVGLSGTGKQLHP